MTEKIKDPRVEALIAQLRDLLTDPPVRRETGEIVREEADSFIHKELLGGMQEILSGLGQPQDNGGQSRMPQGASRKDIEALMDQMVADALLRGRRTTGILESIFNLLPGLSGR